MIATKQRDEILEAFFMKDGNGIVRIGEIAKDLNIHPLDVAKVFNYLKEQRLITIVEVSHDEYEVSFPVQGEDFYKRGGFEYQETIARMELNKLILELESLETLIPKEKYNQLMQGLGIIIAALALTKTP